MHPPVHHWSTRERKVSAIHAVSPQTIPYPLPLPNDIPPACTRYRCYPGEVPRTSKTALRWARLRELRECEPKGSRLPKHNQHFLHWVASRTIIEWVVRHIQNDTNIPHELRLPVALHAQKTTFLS